MTITREQTIQEAMSLFNPTGITFAETERKPKAKDGRDAANARAAVEQMSRHSRERLERLERARGWVEHHAALAYVHHDLAAENAEKRDRYRALVEELEATNGGTAA